METKDIIIFAVVAGFAGIRIYQKYFKKSQNKSDTGSKSGSRFDTSSIGDDYEPYSKKE